MDFYIAGQLREWLREMIEWTFPTRTTVQIPVLVEPLVKNGFCAKAGEPLSLTAEGATPDEAVNICAPPWTGNCKTAGEWLRLKGPPRTIPGHGGNVRS